MNFRTWWEDKLKGSKAAGIEIRLHGASLTIHWVLLSKKGTKLEMISSGKASSLSEMTVPPGIPAVVSISGKGIIHKKIGHAGEADDHALLQKVLPNTKPADFYMQRAELSNGSIIVSVARKSTIDELLEELRKVQTGIVSCIFGPFCIASVIPAMEAHSEIRLPGHTIVLEDGQTGSYIADENNIETEIRVGEKRIDSSLVIPFAAGVGFFTGNSIAANIPQVSDARDEYRQKKIFHFSGAVILAALLSILVVNYLLFDHYWKRKQRLEEISSVNTEAFKKYTGLKVMYDEKMQFLQRTGLMDPSRTSFYADRLAMDIPASIQLTEMHLNPRIRTEQEKEMRFETGNIRIAGHCKRSNELNEWIKLLLKKQWIKDVELVNYKQGKTDPPGEFIINIKTR